MSKVAWFIGILLVILFLQYAYPSKIAWATDPTLGWVKTKVETNNPLDSLKNKLPSVSCPTNFDPVCGSDMVTYNNSCMAGAKGITSVTPGAC